MKLGPSTSAALIATMALAACSSNNPNCTISDYGAPEHPDNLTEVMTAQDRCIDHWAKEYAKSKESAGDVAEATAAQCSGIAQMIVTLSEGENSPIAKTSVVEANRLAREDAIRTAFRYRQECR